MAPEQVRGEPVDARADLFAVGAILHETLTGRQTFQGQSAADVRFLRIAKPTRLHPVLTKPPAPGHWGGVFRKGLWGSRVTRPTNWDTYAEMANGSQQASDHGVVFIDLNI